MVLFSTFPFAECNPVATEPSKNKLSLLINKKTSTVISSCDAVLSLVQLAVAPIFSTVSTPQFTTITEPFGIYHTKLANFAVLPLK